MPSATSEDVSRERLELLLASEIETESVDFKRLIEDSHDGWLEFAKDVGAFSDKGGWIIVGVADDGTRVGIPPVQVPYWDESRVRARLEKYVSGGTRFACKIHRLDEFLIALVHILPHPDGACIFKKDGQRSDGRTVFREGDIFTRRGTSSTRVRQDDMSRILAKYATSVSNTDDAARLARTAALGRLGDPIFDPNADQLWVRLGWSASELPSDLTRRVFFGSDPDLTCRLRSLLERPLLRRSGHSYENRIRRHEEVLQSSGAITHAGEADAHLDVRVSIAGWLSVAISEKVSDWTNDELFGWWIVGAFQVAHELIAELKFGGTLYTCVQFPSKDQMFGVNVLDVSLETDAREITLIPATKVARDETIRIMETVQRDHPWSDAIPVDARFDLDRSNASMNIARTTWKPNDRPVPLGTAFSRRSRLFPDGKPDR